MYLVYGLGCLFDYLFSCLIASCWCCFIVLTCVVSATCVGLWLFVISGYLKLGLCWCVMFAWFADCLCWLTCGMFGLVFARCFVVCVCLLSWHGCDCGYLGLFVCLSLFDCC